MRRIRRIVNHALVDWGKVDQFLCKEAQEVESMFKKWSSDQEGEWKISASFNNRIPEHYLDVRVWMEGEGTARICVSEQFRLVVVMGIEEDQKLDKFFKQIALAINYPKGWSLEPKGY